MMRGGTKVPIYYLGTLWRHFLHKGAQLAYLYTKSSKIHKNKSFLSVLDVIFVGARSSLKNMVSFESEGPKVIDKVDGVDFHLWKFKMKMVLAEKELWEIVEGSEEPPFSFTDPKVRIAYNWRDEKAFGILVLNLSDSQLCHI